MDKYKYYGAARRSDQDRNMDKYQCYRAAERPDQTRTWIGITELLEDVTRT